jgi:hypothetical protein
MNYQREHGYTLIEALLTITLSAIVLLAMSGLIGSLFKGYKASRQLQIDLENARVTLGVITKMVRPLTFLNVNGSVVPGTTQPPQTFVYGYDSVSQQCRAFQFSGTKIQFGSMNAATMGACNYGTVASSFQDLTLSTISSASFMVTGSEAIDLPGNEDGHVGMMTIKFTVQTDPTHSADLQTTVSLRNYDYVGFKK